MPTLIEQLREDLSPDYAVELELGRGGQGSVFRARDTALDRPVAIKVLRPECATADAVERFLTEARTLANLVHPNVVPVHIVGETERLGLPYYVMDLMHDETLADRLVQGPLDPAAALKLGRDLLAAAEAMHAVGVVHRDIKPANVFLESGRAILADFGIAKSPTPPTDIIRALKPRVSTAGDVGAYRLGEMISRGGMGEVYHATHRLLERPAAVKLIRTEFLGQDEGEARSVMLERFRREAKAAAELRSPHTIELYDFGATDQGSFYYVMELLDGLDLESMVQRFGPLPAERAVHVLRQAALSLGEAHQRGLIHRDVKPSNIYASRVGLAVDFVKVLDFGLVKAAPGREAAPLTQPRVATGTPAFMAPEVALGVDIDARADVYSLGCAAFWLLTGRLVFEADSARAMMHCHVAEPPVPPSSRAELPIPPELDALVLRCLAKSPEDRPTNGAALVELLEAIPLATPWSEERARQWWHVHLPHSPPPGSVPPPAGAGSGGRLTDTGAAIGTPGYMPPEQARGEESTPVTDLYAIGMVLFQAYTDRPWDTSSEDVEHDWRGVPRLVRPVLRRALAWRPADRWPDARTFRRALWKTRVVTYRVRTAAIAAGGVLGMLLVWVAARTPPPPLADLAVLPFASRGATDPYLGTDFARLVAHNVEMVDVVPPRIVFQRWDSLDLADRTPTASLATLGSQRVVAGSIAQMGDSLEASIALVTPGDSVDLGRVRGASDDQAALACRVAQVVVRNVDEARGRRFRCNGAYTGKRADALAAFRAGERAAEANRWADALDEYGRAVALDSTFALAAVRHYIAWAWQLRGVPHDLDLKAILAQQHEGLFTQDSLLLDAMTAPNEVERLARYREAVARFPRDGVLAYLYADLVFHRGAFLGLPLEEAERLWTVAADLDSTFAPSWHHLTWVRLLLGDAEGAQSAFDRFSRWVGPPEQVDYLSEIFRFALVERFAPTDIPAAREALLGDPALFDRVQNMLRLAPTVGLHRTQLDLARMFAGQLQAAGSAPPAFLATVVEGEALASMAAGEIDHALLLLDSVARLLPMPETRLQAAAWRLVAPTVGLPDPGAEARAAAAESIRALASPRAWWALGVDAAVRGDAPAAAAWLDRLRATDGDPGAPQLARLLEARLAADDGSPELALDISAPLLQFDSGGRGADPFARSALHAWRATWFEQTGRLEAADSSRRWYLHSDHLVTPLGPAVLEEIDWALGPYAAWVRFGSLRTRDQARACRLGEWLGGIWLTPDAPVAGWRDEVRAYVAETCGR